MTSSSIDVRAQVLEALRVAVNRPVEIDGHTQIVQDLGLDSLAVMNLMLAIEDSFDISIPLNRVAEIVTVDDLVHAVETLA
ncbi:MULTISPECIES: acyl carrier protein [Hydrocarboniphaga]|uniref:acyl carrier protein n=1 Tax=Hydrocarboniphaga TaxID=243627 RepID=UPI00058E2D05|nr:MULTISPECIES: phosphopantetheine-binding protein [Hydrocarboniphaga]MDZ4080464.1 phosphopantetheine-binding protein [Hydrocarboniphaga sp.]